MGAIVVDERLVQLLALFIVEVVTAIDDLQASHFEFGRRSGPVGEATVALPHSRVLAELDESIRKL